MSDETNSGNDPEPASSADVLALISQIISLQARMDALNVAVEMLALNQKIPLDRIRSNIKTMYDSSLQKRLERLEDQDREASSKVDRRTSMPDIDQDFLDGLKQGWKT